VSHPHAGPCLATNTSTLTNTCKCSTGTSLHPMQIDPSPTSGTFHDGHTPHAKHSTSRMHAPICIHPPAYSPTAFRPPLHTPAITRTRIYSRSFIHSTGKTPTHSHLHTRAESPSQFWSARCALRIWTIPRVASCRWKQPQPQRSPAHRPPSARYQRTAQARSPIGHAPPSQLARAHFARLCAV